MATIKRVRCAWSGSDTVGPGLSTFYFSNASSSHSADVKTFFDAIKGMFPTGVTITVPDSGDTIDDATGDLVGTWSATGGGSVTGTSTLAFVRGAGFRVRWLTGGIHKGRRVVGTTFLAPIQSDSFTNDGLPGTTTVAAVLTAATALVTSSAGNMLIWSRPSPGGGSDGVSSSVGAAQVPIAASWLRSRRV